MTSCIFAPKLAPLQNDIAQGNITLKGCYVTENRVSYENTNYRHHFFNVCHIGGALNERVPLEAFYGALDYWSIILQELTGN